MDKVRGQACQRALAERRTLKSRFEPQAYPSRRSVELPLRPSARAAPPSGPRPFPPRLRARERLVMGSVMGADTKPRHLGAAAHESSEIIVSLRTAAIAEAPLSPMLLYRRLQARGVRETVRESACQQTLTRKLTVRERIAEWVLSGLMGSAHSTGSGSSALERFEHRVVLNTRCDDRGRHWPKLRPKPLAGAKLRPFPKRLDG